MPVEFEVTRAMIDAGEEVFRKYVPPFVSERSASWILQRIYLAMLHGAPSVVRTEVTPAMREAGAMTLLEVRSCLCETEEDAAEAIFMAMIHAMSG